MINEITMNDIKTKSSECVDNKVRKAWVLTMPEEYKERLKSFPSNVKMSFYKEFDKTVHDNWVAKLKEANQKAVEAGAKLVGKDGLKHYEEQYCVETDELLIEAAKEFVIKFIEENPTVKGNA